MAQVVAVCDRTDPGGWSDCGLGLGDCGNIAALVSGQLEAASVFFTFRDDFQYRAAGSP